MKIEKLPLNKTKPCPLNRNSCKPLAPTFGISAKTRIKPLKHKNRIAKIHMLKFILEIKNFLHSFKKVNEVKLKTKNTFKEEVMSLKHSPCEWSSLFDALVNARKLNTTSKN